jgi:hypothetical protein
LISVATSGTAYSWRRHQSLEVGAPGPAGAAARTSIAESSVQDMAATFRANNVDDPERWARVIAQNRPYPADDPNLGKLRQVLAQSQADPPTIDRITNALTP